MNLYDLIDAAQKAEKPPAAAEFALTNDAAGIVCSACGAVLPCVVYEGDRCHDCYRKEHPAQLVATPEKPKKTRNGKKP